jgi:plasmid rolling circle replication initiator protein Rep
MLAAPTAELGDRPLLASVPAMARFTKRKRFHADIANLLRQAPELVEMARSIQNCADALEVLLELPEGGDPFAMLTGYNPCNRRACPMCEWRRSLVWRGRLMPGLDAFFDAHPTHRAIFLTLTVRNVPLVELRQSIKDIHAAWNRLLQWREFPTNFWFRRTEITVGQPSFADDLPVAKPARKSAGRRRVGIPDGPDSSPEGHRVPDLASSQALQGVWCHPHIHALLLVPASYFSHGYVRNSEWQRQWMMAGRLDYAPVVDVRRAAAKFTTGEAFYDAKAAGIEAMKYAVKATDMLKMAADLPEFIHQTRGHRLVAMSQGLRSFVPEHEPTALEMGDDRAAGLPRLHPGVSCLAQWDRKLSSYVLTPR